MITTPSTYRTEQALIRDICKALHSARSPWPNAAFATEFEYQRGRADVVAVCPDGTVIAFEAKLNKWRDAVHQAYKNTCFAHYSYVVLPASTARLAARAIGEFSRHSVGLCTASRGRLEVILPATFRAPVQPWLSQLARSSAETHH